MGFEETVRVFSSTCTRKGFSMFIRRARQAGICNLSCKSIIAAGDGGLWSLRNLLSLADVVRSICCFFVALVNFLFVSCLSGSMLPLSHCFI
ncbi:hypothetical protein SLEP1_g29014 [Rubroshorea leprosula]|uniref:Uncharacterized protein n=1 Tax=Rubroshorea leprosula TaxID=152421 RepID=A0AAV5K187_9ROSI|nr:hypothetical protein SLEP1_g29014 [Rubroshorea leprosula]